MKTGRLRSGVLGIVGEALCLAESLCSLFVFFAYSRFRSRLGLDHSGRPKTVGRSVSSTRHAEICN